MYKPTTSRVFSTKSGSVESLNVSVRCGCKPNVFQIRTIADCERPVSAAISRVLQCVAFFGRDVSVFVMTSSTRSSVMRRGGPDRGASLNPCRRIVRKRSRHLHTVARETATRWATASFESPLLHNRMMLARSTSCCADFGRRTQRCNSARSSSVTVSSRSGRPSGMLNAITRRPFIQRTRESQH